MLIIFFEKLLRKNLIKPIDSIDRVVEYKPPNAVLRTGNIAFKVGGTSFKSYTVSVKLDKTLDLADTLGK